MKLLDFLNILALITLFTGVVVLIDKLLQRFNKNDISAKKTNIFLEYCYSFFPVLLIVLMIRSFAFQPFRVPSESLEPTVMPGDLIFVTQFDYGLKIPLWEHVFFPVGNPNRGQIALFRAPVNPTGFTLVKRVIGVPGDRISYINKVLYINGKEMKQKFIESTLEVFSNGKTRPAKKYEENLGGVKHLIIINPNVVAQNFKNLTVPKGSYFMMGDNRDDSDDSRAWGFAPIQNFIGQARFVWFSVTFSPFHIYWNRIGKTFAL